MSIANSRTARYMVIRSNGAPHGGFPIRNTPGKAIPKGYQLMGYAMNTHDLYPIMFPKG